MSREDPRQAAPAQLLELLERSRRIGDDPSLVLYGGGNTSAKGEVLDHLGRRQRVLWVKGSGADMHGSVLADYPALRLDDLTPLRERDAMSDEEMTDLVARALLDPAARRPSIETLLHAFLPFTHIDHVHADAICTLTNHANGPQITREALGDDVAYVDWLRPGFELSRIVSELAGYRAVVLAHHGLITWAEDSQECWRQTRSIVDAAESFIEGTAVARGSVPATVPGHEDLPDDDLRLLLLRLRGALCGTGRRLLRVDARLRSVADHPRVDQIVGAGVSSADHMLRIKPQSLVVTSPAEAVASVQAYATDYSAYVARHAAQLPPGTGPHDPMPRVMLVPGVGAVTTGISEREMTMRADIALHTHDVARQVVECFGDPEPLSEQDTFDFDYWPMELFKLTLQPPALPFAGSVVLVTGAASGIGRGIAEHLGAQGAALVLADLDESGLRGVSERITAGGGVMPRLVVGDQSDPALAARTVHEAIDAFGGVDGVVLNAGIGVPGTIDELTPDRWNAALSINLTSAFLLTQAAMRAMREQGCGGSMAFVASKNAFGPGAGFGAYSVSKAGMIQLMRIAALEGGSDGIRANAVNPDAVFDNSRLWEGGIREERAAAHGIAPEDLEDFYAARNLLHRRVRTADVAAAVAFLLSDAASRTTGTVLTVDGGVAGAFPR